ncbi:MAG: TlpA family protein disulfide reductase [Clostridia bacterium]|nr:TlpA family protein disulfide reductase [Clostridia bacterium]
MKRMIALLLALVLCFSLASCAADRGQGSGTENDSMDSSTQDADNEEIYAPDITVYTLDGEAVKLSDLRSKPVVLNFWATWCPPCKAELPHFEKLSVEYRGEVEFMMVNLTDGTRDTEELVRSFIESEGYTFPVYCDTEMQAYYLYGVNSIPVTFFIDARGRIQNAYTGAMSEEQLRGYIEEMRK